MRTADTAAMLTGMEELAGRYRFWLCDIWGVVHNGIVAFAPALDALSRFRSGGGTVVLVSNAPRPSDVVIAQLAGLGVGTSHFDGIVTSGDATRELLRARAGQAVFHLGPERDRPLIADLPLHFTGLGEADLVVCSGLFDDSRETAEDYDAMLTEMRDRGLDLYCANPDEVVRRGDDLIPCAGALARRYRELGGRAILAGKPYGPIYDRAFDILAGIAGRRPERAEVLAIGDGIATDMKGAADYGLDAVFVLGGIHGLEPGSGGARGPMTAARIAREVPGIRLAGIIDELKW